MTVLEREDIMVKGNWNKQKLKNVFDFPTQEKDPYIFASCTIKIKAQNLTTKDKETEKTIPTNAVQVQMPVEAVLLWGGVIVCLPLGKLLTRQALVLVLPLDGLD